MVRVLYPCIRFFRFKMFSVNFFLPKNFPMSVGNWIQLFISHTPKTFNQICLFAFSIIHLPKNSFSFFRNFFFSIRVDHYTNMDFVVVWPINNIILNITRKIFFCFFFSWFHFDLLDCFGFWFCFRFAPLQNPRNTNKAKQKKTR